MTDNLHLLGRNLRSVLHRIAAACQRAGRKQESVRLIAVTKYIGPELARALYDLGVKDFGENRLQVAEPKVTALADLPIRWHWIGRLQTNKTHKALESFSEIHSIDRLELVEALDRRLSAAAELLRKQKIQVYIQVNISGEESKSGVRPDEADALAERILASPYLDWVGLMTMAPEYADPGKTRPVFSGLRELCDQMAARYHRAGMRLSMGMSHDFEVAVEEGATDLRIGSVLFEGLL